VDIPATYLERIRAMRPNLTIEDARLNSDGLANDVIIVNGEWVFRFAKNDMGRAMLAGELAALDLIAGHSPIPVPRPVTREDDAMTYRFMPGEPLTHWRFAALDAPTQQRIAAQLGAFLRCLHSIEPQGNLRVVTPEQRRARWRKRRIEIEAALTPHLLPFQREWMARLFDDALSDTSFFNYAPRLVNNDLAPYHILFDIDKGELSGVIDFGTACFDDPALDSGCLMQHHGESFVTRLFTSYPGAQTLLPRARFYAQAIELDWAALGIERNETFWFTAHIGNARHAHFPIQP
jgi:aminoglycoside 2''-phosphotransferase